MSFNIRIIVIAAAVMALIVYGIFLMPPLTTGGGSMLPGVSHAALEREIVTERGYCEENIDDVDCACFAEKAGLIRAAEGPRIDGALYVDQTELARDQAASSC